MRRFVPWLNAVEDRYRLALNLCENPLNTSLTRANISARPRCAFFRSLSLERLFRDVRAGRYHPLTKKKQLEYTARYTLGLDID